MWYSRRKNLSRTRVWLIGKKGKNFNVCLKKPLMIYKKKKPLGTSIQTLVKANFTKNFGLNPKNQLTRPISFASFTRCTNAIRYTKVTNLFSNLEDIVQQ